MRNMFLCLILVCCGLGQSQTADRVLVRETKGGEKVYGVKLHSALDYAYKQQDQVQVYLLNPLLGFSLRGDLVYVNAQAIEAGMLHIQSPTETPGQLVYGLTPWQLETLIYDGMAYGESPYAKEYFLFWDSAVGKNREDEAAEPQPDSASQLFSWPEVAVGDQQFSGISESIHFTASSKKQADPSKTQRDYYQVELSADDGPITLQGMTRALSAKSFILHSSNGPIVVAMEKEKGLHLSCGALRLNVSY